MAVHHAHPENPEVHHESTDVNIRGIFVFAAGLVLAAAIIHFLVWLLLSLFTAREAERVAPQFPLAIGQENRLPPEPRLQTNPRQDLRDLRAGEDAILGTYGWVDKNQGVVRIPINEAMKLTLQHGLPSRPGPSPFAPAGATSDGDANSGREIGDIKK
jgi:hypothetical protein